MYPGLTFPNLGPRYIRLKLLKSDVVLQKELWASHVVVRELSEIRGHEIQGNGL